MLRLMISRFEVTSPTPVWSRYSEGKCNCIEESDKTNGMARFHALSESDLKALGGADMTSQEVNS